LGGLRIHPAVNSSPIVRRVDAGGGAAVDLVDCGGYSFWVSAREQQQVPGVHPAGQLFYEGISDALVGAGYQCDALLSHEANVGLGSV
jgi:hypothetical protein